MVAAFNECRGREVLDRGGGAGGRYVGGTVVLSEYLPTYTSYVCTND